MMIIHLSVLLRLLGVTGIKPTGKLGGIQTDLSGFFGWGNR